MINIQDVFLKKLNEFYKKQKLFFKKMKKNILSLCSKIFINYFFYEIEKIKQLVQMQLFKEICFFYFLFLISVNLIILKMRNSPIVQ